MSLIGKILWWDERDGNGIIKDASGRKYYFDTSVIEVRPRSKIGSGKVVRFQINKKIKDSLCACAVVFITTKDRALYRDEIRGLENSNDVAA